MNAESTEGFYKNAYLYFLLAFAVTVAGFWPSYFSRLTETGAAHHFHGITASLWMLILIAQPLLYRLNKMELHKFIGRSTFLLVPLLIIGGVIMMNMMLNNERCGPLAYQLAFIDLFVLLQFLLLCPCYQKRQEYAVPCAIYGMHYFWPVDTGFNKAAVSCTLD